MDKYVEVSYWSHKIVHGLWVSWITKKKPNYGKSNVSSLFVCIHDWAWENWSYLHLQDKYWNLPIFKAL